MNVDIITPDKNLYTGEASSIVVPGTDGLLGILENHAPLISSLKAGEVKITTPSGEKKFEVGGGVVEVMNNKVIILAG